ncbi:MAG: LLM class flavin-dependent oxidoreductase [Actinomycetota bacterium]|nr:LLM class flavin-dependent oxidoreductase [Actinomycetota bacterium]
MRIGLALPHYDTSLAGAPASWEGVRRVARLAEDSGFDSVWVSDHLFLDWGRYGGPSDAQGSLECWTALSAIAASTSRVRVGSLTLCNDLRAPALLAKMAAAVDLLSGGRLDLALGAGWYQQEYQRAGIEFARPGIRIERLGEAVEVIQRLLEGEELHFRGRHYRIEGAVCCPGPHRKPRPPVWIGGKGDRLLDTAARIADGWNMSWLGSLEPYRDRLDAATAACERAGRDPASLRRSVGVYVLVGRDDGDARSRFERLAERTPAGVLQTDNGRAAVSWEEFRRGHFAGTVGEVLDRLGPLKELGVEEVIVTLGTLPFQVANEDDVGLVGSEIAPALR